MASLSIPDEYVNGLAAILSLNDETAEELFSAFQSIPLKLFTVDRLAEIIPKVPSISPDDLEDIVEALHSLYISALHHDVFPNDLAEDLTQAIEESDIEELRLSNEN